MDGLPGMGNILQYLVSPPIFSICSAPSALPMSSVLSFGEQRAVRFHPPAYDIRVETISIPKSAVFSPSLSNKGSCPSYRILHPDDAIVKVTVSITIFHVSQRRLTVHQLAGLCGSDLHVYRGHEEVDAV